MLILLWIKCWLNFMKYIKSLVYVWHFLSINYWPVGTTNQDWFNEVGYCSYCESKLYKGLLWSILGSLSILPGTGSHHCHHWWGKTDHHEWSPTRGKEKFLADWFLWNYKVVKNGAGKSSLFLLSSLERGTRWEERADNQYDHWLRFRELSSNDYLYSKKNVCSIPVWWIRNGWTSQLTEWWLSPIIVFTKWCSCCGKHLGKKKSN